MEKEKDTKRTNEMNNNNNIDKMYQLQGQLQEQQQKSSLLVDILKSLVPFDSVVSSLQQQQQQQQQQRQAALSAGMIPKTTTIKTSEVSERKYRLVIGLKNSKSHNNDNDDINSLVNSSLYTQKILSLSGTDGTTNNNNRLTVNNTVADLTRWLVEHLFASEFLKCMILRSCCTDEHNNNILPREREYVIRLHYDNMKMTTVHALFPHVADNNNKHESRNDGKDVSVFLQSPPEAGENRSFIVSPGDNILDYLNAQITKKELKHINNNNNNYCQPSLPFVYSVDIDLDTRLHNSFINGDPINNKYYSGYAEHFLKVIFSSHNQIATMKYFPNIRALFADESSNPIIATPPLHKNVTSPEKTAVSGTKRSPNTAPTVKVNGVTDVSSPSAVDKNTDTTLKKKKRVSTTPKKKVITIASVARATTSAKSSNTNKSPKKTVNLSSDPDDEGGEKRNSLSSKKSIAEDKNKLQSVTSHTSTLENAGKKKKPAASPRKCIVSVGDKELKYKNTTTTTTTNTTATSSVMQNVFQKKKKKPDESENASGEEEDSTKIIQDKNKKTKMVTKNGSKNISRKRRASSVIAGADATTLPGKKRKTNPRSASKSKTPDNTNDDTSSANKNKTTSSITETTTNTNVNPSSNPKTKSTKTGTIKKKKRSSSTSKTVRDDDGKKDNNNEVGDKIMEKEKSDKNTLTTTPKAVKETKSKRKLPLTLSSNRKKITEGDDDGKEISSKALPASKKRKVLHDSSKTTTTGIENAVVSDNDIAGTSAIGSKKKKKVTKKTVMNEKTTNVNDTVKETLPKKLAILKAQLLSKPNSPSEFGKNEQNTLSRFQLEVMTKTEIKEHLRARHLTVSGTKIELIERLLTGSKQ